MRAKIASKRTALRKQKAYEASRREYYVARDAFWAAEKLAKNEMEKDRPE